MVRFYLEIDERDVGDPVADCKVLSQDGTQELRLRDLIRQDCPVVLMGASHT